MATDYSQKFCLECKHLDYENYIRGFDYTPCDLAEMRCRLGIWEMTLGCQSREEFYHNIRMARTCDQFELDTDSKL